MGLVQYDSSDEDEEVQTPVEPKVRAHLRLTHRRSHQQRRKAYSQVTKQTQIPAVKPSLSDTQNAPGKPRTLHGI